MGCSEHSICIKMSIRDFGASSFYHMYWKHEQSNDLMTNVDLRESWTLDTKTIFPSLKIYHDLSICQVLPFSYKVNIGLGRLGARLWSQIGQMGQIEIHGSNSFTCQHHTRHQFWSTLKRRKIPRSGDWGVKENKENLMYISLDAQDVSLWISIDPFWCLEYLSLKKFT